MNRNYFEIKRGSYGNGGSSQKLPPFPFIYSPKNPRSISPSNTVVAGPVMYTRFSSLSQEMFKSPPRSCTVTGFFAVNLVIEDGSYRNCAGACAAGKCLAGTAFPYTHLYGVAVDHLNKFSVDSVGKHT